jgi:hypothetical protein
VVKAKDESLTGEQKGQGSESLFGRHKGELYDYSENPEYEVVRGPIYG